MTKKYDSNSCLVIHSFCQVPYLQSQSRRLPAAHLNLLHAAKIPRAAAAVPMGGQQCAALHRPHTSPGCGSQDPTPNRTSGRGLLQWPVL